MLLAHNGQNDSCFDPSKIIHIFEKGVKITQHLGHFYVFRVRKRNIDQYLGLLIIVMISNLEIGLSIDYLQRQLFPQTQEKATKQKGLKKSKFQIKSLVHTTKADANASAKINISNVDT